MSTNQVAGVVAPKQPAANKVPDWNLVPSSELPLMTGLRVKLLKSLQDDESYLTISLLLTELVDELKHQTIPVAATVTDFRAREAQMITLLHFIPRNLMFHMIAGTLAWAHCNRDMTKLELPSGAGCGTYGVSLSIQGRNGSFLCIAELERFCGYIDDYISGYRWWSASGSMWGLGGPASKSHRDFVHSIDGQYGSRSLDGSPRFCKNQSNLAELEALKAMFESRIQHNLDPTGLVWQREAPIYVGCAEQPMQDRYPDHIPGSLTNSNKLWSVTLCLLKHMGLHVKVTAVPVLATFLPGHLPASERLVTTIARSLVSQAGFNKIQGGGKPDSKANRFEEKRTVCARHTYLNDNLTLTLEKIAHMSRYVRLYKTLKDLKLDNLDVKIQRLTSDLITLKEQAEEYEEEVERVRQRAHEWEIEEQGLSTVRDDWQSLNNAMGQMDFADILDSLDE